MPRRHPAGEWRFGIYGRIFHRDDPQVGTVCRGSTENETCLLRPLAVVSDLPVKRLTRASELRQCSSPLNKGNFATQIKVQRVSAAKSPRFEGTARGNLLAG